MAGMLVMTILLSLWTGGMTARKAGYDNGNAQTTNQGEWRLQHWFQRYYSATVRPVRELNDTIEVAVAISPIRLLHVNEEQETVELEVWVRQRWHDAFLVWEPSEYNGVEYLHMSSHKLWTPRIGSLDSEHHGDTGHKDDHIYLQADGTVKWHYPTKLKANCDMRLNHYPLDRKHRCKLHMGSIIYNSKEVSLRFYDNKTSLDFGNYRNHNHWRISCGDGKLRTRHDKWAVGEHDVMRFDLHLTRRSWSQDFALLVVPVALIALLIPVIFLLPSGHKINLGIGLLVSLTLFFTMLDRNLPAPSSHVPALEQYYAGVFMLICLALLLASVTTSMVEGTVPMTEPPRVLRRLTRILLSCVGWITCIRRVAPYRQAPNIGASGDEDHQLGTATTSYSSLTSLDKAEQEDSTVAEQNRRQAALGMEWRIIATILDRLFFLLFILAALIVLPTVVLLSLYSICC